VRDGEGRPSYFISVVEDIAARKRAEAELQALNATLEQRVAERTAEAGRQAGEARQAAEALARQTTLLQTILDSMAEGVSVADRSGRMVLTNAAGREMVGLGVAPGGAETWPAHYGVFLPDGATPFPPGELPLALAVGGQASQNVEMVIRNPHCPAGRILHVSGRPLRGGDGTHQAAWSPTTTSPNSSAPPGPSSGPTASWPTPSRN
jgi:PAS domain-containing protein